ncbi:phosphoenolpyruvate carboxykinase (ATP), partial [Staphylococcus aureus]|uniref:phosphoenolpyruvate carboxykinase (ATP) n=1 Tax=Staphylococcus aureus TaxID=1280 RepID=UPI001054BC7C
MPDRPKNNATSPFSPTSHFQLSTTQLYNKILDNNEGVLTELGAVNASTGKYTGRSP